MAKDSIELALSVLESEKGNLSPEQRQRLAELTKAGEDVREDVTGALEAGESKPAESDETEKRELAPEQAEELLGTLKTRFELPENEKLRKAVDFAVVEKSLRADPEKLYVLHKLEESGGEPQVIGIDGDEFVFEDRSKESPSGRRNRNAYQVADEAEEWGVDVQSPDAYKAMQKTGKFDMETYSWLKTDPEHRERTGYAVYGHRSVVGVDVRGNDAKLSAPSVGWRASLRVKKV